MKTIPGHLDPHQIVRRKDGPKYFGYKHAALEEKIRSGDIPMPITLSEKGRATGWTGQQIIDHQTKMLESAIAHTNKRKAIGERLLKSRKQTRRSMAGA